MTDKQSPLASFSISTLYFAEGLPYTIVNMMSIIMLKNLGVDNGAIGYWTSLLAIPWTLKFLWAPLVDLYGTRRQWVVVAQTVLGVLTLLLAPALVFAGASVNLLLAILFAIAVASATQDIAIDGFYLDLLDRARQALFVGLRNASYKIAWLFGSGAMVYLAGKWAERQQNLDIAPGTSHIAQGWALSFAVCGGLLAALAIIHQFFLPHPLQQRREQTATFSLVEALTSFADQPRFGVIVFYILSFRLGDALLLKMAQPFLLDASNKGGLALSTADVGAIYGTVGIVAFLIGGLLGGWVVSRIGLQRSILPTAIAQNSAILLYWLLAIYKPGLSIVAITNALEQLAYGFGTAAFTVFLLRVVKNEFKAAHYAMASAIMALGLLLPGMVSGYSENVLGYQNFFLLSFLCSMPGMLIIPFLPLTMAQPSEASS